MDLNHINDMQLDVLREIGNIGAGNAATSLSKMLDKRIDMNVPVVKLVPFKEVEDIIGGAETPVVGIYLEIQGQISGTIMFILDHQSAVNLVQMLVGTNEYKLNPEDPEDLGISVLLEIGNILAGSYLGALTALTGLLAVPSVPDLAVDMAGAIVSVPLIEYGQVGDKAMVIETELQDGLDHVKGNFFLVPDIESYTRILISLGAG